MPVSSERDHVPAVPHKSILIIDDEPSIASGLKRLLSRDGYIVETVANGHLALTKLREHSYDLLLSDMRMPEIDGPRLYRTLERQYPQSAPARYLSHRGYAQPRDQDVPRSKCGAVPDQTLDGCRDPPVPSSRYWRRSNLPRPCRPACTLDCSSSCDPQNLISFAIRYILCAQIFLETEIITAKLIMP